jgi:hypothetical protein
MRHWRQCWWWLTSGQPGATGDRSPPADSVQRLGAHFISCSGCDKDFVLVCNGLLHLRMAFTVTGLMCNNPLFYLEHHAWQQRVQLKCMNLKLPSLGMMWWPSSAGCLACMDSPGLSYSEY